MDRSSHKPGIDRRAALVGALSTGFGLAHPHVARAQAPAATPSFSVDPFKLGVASGDPSADGFVIWTRLAPTPLTATGGLRLPRVAVRWEVARDHNMRDLVQNGDAIAHTEAAHSVHVEVAGLEPACDYFYRFHSGGATSAIGRARTLPAAGAQVAQIRFASAGCQAWEGGYYTAWKSIAAEAYDFVCHYGDYIYEYGSFKQYRDGTAPPRTMPANFGVCRTLSDYRMRYALYKSDADLQAAHASCPFIASFDDHEVTDNWASDSDPAATPKELFWFRRAAAFQAWWEHMPVRASLMPRGPDITAYRAFSLGALVDIQLLDTRQYRSRQPCGDGFKAVCDEALDRNRTMLGETQELWLDSRLSESRAVWCVLAQQVLFSSINLAGAAGAESYDLDAWDGAPAARERLLGSLAAHRIANPVILSGDFHRSVAADVRSANGASIAAVEFLAPSISSRGDMRDEGIVEAQLRARNAQLKFYGTQHGYTAHTLTPAQWRADYRVIDRLDAPDGIVSTRKSFVVEAGRRGLIEA